MKKYYNFTKENLYKALVPNSIFEYPQVEIVIIKCKGQEDILYKRYNQGFNIDVGYYCWYKTKCGNEYIDIDLNNFVKELMKTNVISMWEVDRKYEVAPDTTKALYIEIELL